MFGLRDPGGITHVRGVRAFAFSLVVAAFIVLFSPVLVSCDRHSPPHPPGYDSLLDAIESKNARSVEKILDSGLNPNSYPSSDADLRAEEDIVPLDVAAEDGSTEIVRILIDHGADPNMGDGWHENPLAAATQSESLDTMRLLIQRGAVVNDEPTGSSSLWRAAMDGKVRSVLFLLNHGANPRTKIYADDKDSLLDALEFVKASPQVIEIIRRRAQAIDRL